MDKCSRFHCSIPKAYVIESMIEEEMFTTTEHPNGALILEHLSAAHTALIGPSVEQVRGKVVVF